MNEQLDWQLLQREWQRGGSSHAEVATAFRRLSRARRGLLLTRIAEAAIVVASLFFLLMALRHAANPLVATLGIVVSIGNLIIWIQRMVMRRREGDFEFSSSVDYLAAMRQLRQRQVRLAEFVWVLLTLELVFFIPWWVIGSRVHSRRITDIGSLLTMWAPIAVIIGLYVWAFRLRAVGRREVQAIDRLEPNSDAM